jgi:opacity protein-like surface antigen
MMNRIRTLAVAAALAVVPASMSAQAAATPAFGVGTKLLSVGILTGGDYEGFGFGGSFEYGLLSFTPRVSLGIGGSIGYVSDEDFGVDVSAMPIMAIGNVHFAMPTQPKLDLYGGLSVGVIRAEVDCGTIAGVSCNASDTESGFGLQVGARYWLTNRVGVKGQLGLGDIPLLNAGVSFRF